MLRSQRTPAVPHEPPTVPAPPVSPAPQPRLLLLQRGPGLPLGQPDGARGHAAARRQRRCGRPRLPAAAAGHRAQHRRGAGCLQPAVRPGLAGGAGEPAAGRWALAPRGGLLRPLPGLSRARGRAAARVHGAMHAPACSLPVALRCVPTPSFVSLLEAPHNRRPTTPQATAKSWFPAWGCTNTSEAGAALGAAVAAAEGEPRRQALLFRAFLLQFCAGGYYGEFRELAVYATCLLGALGAWEPRTGRHAPPAARRLVLGSASRPGRSRRAPIPPAEPFSGDGMTHSGLGGIYAPVRACWGWGGQVGQGGGRRSLCARMPACRAGTHPHPSPTGSPSCRSSHPSPRIPYTGGRGVHHISLHL